MNLYVMRHGEVDFNVKNQINGINNVGLNNNGIMQAKSKKNEIDKLNIDFILCSPLERTKQTCSYATENKFPIFYEKRLLERDSKSMQFQSVDILDSTIWYDKTKEIVYKDSEGFKSVLNRVYELLNEIKEKYNDKNVLLITHGDVCKAIFTYFNKDEKIDISKQDQGNCEIVTYIL